MKKYILEEQPEYRQKAFKENPQMFDLAKKYNEKLYKLVGGNPNEFAASILPKIRKRHEALISRSESKVTFTKEETEFMKKSVSFNKYLELTTELVNDPQYKELSGPIEVKVMDQKNDPEGWKESRAGILDDYRKYVVSSPSGVHPKIKPQDAKYFGQSAVYMKHVAQGLDVLGDIPEFDPLIAERGHDTEEFARKYVPKIIKSKYDINVDVFPEPERLVEHCVFGDFMHGNTDGVAFNIDSGELEGIEIKTTEVFNTIENYKNGLIPPEYLTQIACYMSIMNFNVFNLIAAWGISWSQGMTGIRVYRDENSEAYLLAKMLHFTIEYVVKDKKLPEDMIFASPEVLVPDLYAIYGNAKPKTSIEDNSKNAIEAAQKYQALSKEIKILKAQHALQLESLEKELSECESKLLMAAQDNEKLTVKDERNDYTGIFYFKDRESNRFSSKLFKEAVSDYKRKKYTDKEMLDLILNDDSFKVKKTTRSMKQYIPKG